MFFGIGIGALIAIQGLIAFLYGLNTSLVKGQTMVFCLITISEMFNAFNWRSDRVSLLKLGFFTNKPLISAVIITVLLQILVVYAPFLQKPFNTTPINLTDWFLIVLLGSTTFIFMEGVKFIEKRRRQNNAINQ